MSGVGFSETLLIASVVGLSVLWFWALIDCAIREHRRDFDKLVWVLIIVSTWIFGAVAYLLMWRSRTRPAPVD
ncbi:MAG: PLD nuclease N-terminal domain-containing protein [Thermoanaerobaculia bacterium]